MRLFEFINEDIDADYRVEAASAFSSDELSAVAGLIAQGGEVDPGMVLTNLRNSPLIGAAFINGAPVGAVVLKRPNPGYRSKVFQSSGVPELEARFQLEVGYAFVLPEYRTSGISARLMRAMNRAMPPNVFATTREQNTTINTILKFAGFSPTGEPYASARGDYRLILWTR